ncbi:MAG: MBL fold metallo-hydrolase [bacterium]
MEVKVLYSRPGMGQHIWITNDNGAVLIDTGDGILRDIRSNGLDIGQIRGVIFTHGHFDHMGGLYSLLGYLRLKGKEEVLPIFAPEGCAEVSSIVDSFTQCYRDTMHFKIPCTEVYSHEVFQIAEMDIEAYPVVHCGSIKGHEVLEEIPAVGYRFSYKGETVAVSGDTGDCASLRELVKGADLAIIEAVIEKSEHANDEVLKKVHLSEDLAKAIGRSAKNFILVHRGGRQEP